MITQLLNYTVSKDIQNSKFILPVIYQNSRIRSLKKCPRNPNFRSAAVSEQKVWFLGPLGLETCREEFHNRTSEKSEGLT